MPPVSLTAVALVEPDRWREYSAADDPWPSHQPEDVNCGVGGYYVETVFDPPVLEVDTAYCNYLLLQQPCIVSVERGSTVQLDLRHYALRAPAAAEAHLAVLVNDHIEWEAHTPIPSDAAVEHIEWSAQNVWQQGDMIRLHLHNHGQNTWVFAGLHALLDVRP